jgi:IPT/TIG domain-containing protein
MRSGRMLKASSVPLGRRGNLSRMAAREESKRWPGKMGRRMLWLGLSAGLILFSPLLFSQGGPRVTGVEPASGKVNDSVTMAGENLGKSSITGVFLSDEKTDYKASVVDQAADKVVFKVPQVKAGDYNVSIQVGNNILIQPIRFKVQE